MGSRVVIEAAQELMAAPETRASDSHGPAARPKPPQRSHLVVLCLAVAFYLALCYHLLRGELRATGTLTFPLDDTYITMALAKNFALHGAWGLGNTGFQSSTSTPGFLLLLAAAFRILGPSEWLPLAFSLLFGLFSIFAAQQLLASEPTVTQVLALAAMIFFAPLHVIGIVGMEHTLHLCLALVFLNLFCATYAEDGVPRRRLLLVTACMVSLRYEGLFFAAGAILLLLVQKRLRAAIALGAAAAAPVILYGILSVLHGCYWLPHSISLKGISGKAASRSPVEFAHHSFVMLGRAPYLGALLALLAILLALPAARANLRRRAMLGVVAVGMVLHLALADVGWVYRYEAYLIGSAIAAIALAVSTIELRQVVQRLAAVACILIAAAGSFLLYQRTAEADATIPLRSLAVYCQQIQMARFLHQFETGSTVAANDVGAINYFADINCVDLAGLGDKEIFWLKRHGDYTTEAMANLIARRQTKIAIVYDSWFSPMKLPITSGPPLPPSWIRVERWATPNGVFLGDGIVSFYAMTSADAAELRRDLAQFDESSLPSVDRVLPD